MLDFYRFSNLKCYPTLKHLVSTKASNHPYSFSLALHTGEEPHAIVQNRHTLAKFMGSEALHFVVAQQTHSDHIHIVTQQSTQGWLSQEDAITNSDALITQQPHVVLSILTADCVPILLYDKQKHVIAAIHAGWKGTHANIVAKTVQEMIQSFNSNPKDIIAGIAPSIGRCCYEVGEEVATHFSEIPNAYDYTQKTNKYMLDLPTINQKQLLNIGLLPENIEMSNLCTACEEDRFFSYRKTSGCSGRFMSMIMLLL